MGEIILIDGCPGGAPCDICGEARETRFGVCFDCASAGEGRAAQRTVWQHFRKGVGHLFGGNPNARYDLAWAWERLTRTGDYTRGGYFEREYPGLMDQ